MLSFHWKSHREPAPHLATESPWLEARWDCFWDYLSWDSWTGAGICGISANPYSLRIQIVAGKLRKPNIVEPRNLPIRNNGHKTNTVTILFHPIIDLSSKHVHSSNILSLHLNPLRYEIGWHFDTRRIAKKWQMPRKIRPVSEQKKRAEICEIWNIINSNMHIMAGEWTWKNGAKIRGSARFIGEICALC